MILFTASLLVAVLGTAFNAYQARRYSVEYEARIRNILPADSEWGYGLSPDVIRAWFDRSLDIAANFPAFVLTLVAYSELPILQSQWATLGIIMAAVIGTVPALISSGPKSVGGFSLRWISLWTASILTLNIIGIALNLIG